MSPELAETVKRLRERLLSATKEAWKYVDGEDGRPFICTEGDIICVPDGNHQPPDAMDLGNFAYIAAADPSAISSILDALEGLERERDEARAESGALLAGVREYLFCYDRDDVVASELWEDLNKLANDPRPAANLVLARITSLESSLAEARKGARTEEGWRCFHCDEAFTNPTLAEQHFGASELETPACQIVDLVKLYREAQELLEIYRTGDNESYREFYRLGAAHTTALRESEQKGYDAGLADGRAQHPTAPQETAEKEGE